MIHFACPRCGTAYNEPEDAGGRKFDCSQAACGQKIQVPESVGSQTMGGIPLPKERGPISSGKWYPGQRYSSCESFAQRLREWVDEQKIPVA